MGDEFTAKGPSLSASSPGAPRPSRESMSSRTSSTSTRPRPEPTKSSSAGPMKSRSSVGDLSWYYVRVIQEDGEIAWASPIWVHKPSSDVVKKTDVTKR